ncbi:flagellar basal body rod protein FlgF [Denitrificimonas sp. JX-1]|uniref:Flagellar basal-body rod protein FlgF n=1 Tax=Denitrificimonas halotolerans TaxID=3098930 RepID=A0ABU5GRT2_9GAMM|nr:flagellar basal body rod protein FlgF [Denitrificimonas sp. JX-1]MDY7219698.1 flagellar basal body rod protein FlgF [Denitrificimonas sp. JX-1]
MDRIIYTAMSGAQQTLDTQAVVSHNLANATTTGFRAQLSAMRAVPVQGDALLPTRTSVVASTPRADFSVGNITTTDRALDVAIQAGGWLAVQDNEGQEAYSRRGDLQVDSNGLLLSGGRPVLGDGGPIIVPLESQLSIGADGTISAIGVGETPDALVQVDRLKLVQPDESQLLRGADGLFRPDPASGPMVLPQDENIQLVSGALESSNVSAIESMVAMIDNARRYDMQMKVISSADENAQRANSLLSLQG